MEPLPKKKKKRRHQKQLSRMETTFIQLLIIPEMIAFLTLHMSVHKKNANNTNSLIKKLFEEDDFFPPKLRVFGWLFASEHLLVLAEVLQRYINFNCIKQLCSGINLRRFIISDCGFWHSLNELKVVYFYLTMSSEV